MKKMFLGILFMVFLTILGSSVLGCSSGTLGPDPWVTQEQCDTYIATNCPPSECVASASGYSDGVCSIVNCRRRSDTTTINLDDGGKFDLNTNIGDDGRSATVSATNFNLNNPSDKIIGIDEALKFGNSISTAGVSLNELSGYAIIDGNAVDWSFSTGINTDTDLFKVLFGEEIKFGDESIFSAQSLLGATGTGSNSDIESIPEFSKTGIVLALVLIAAIAFIVFARKKKT